MQSPSIRVPPDSTGKRVRTQVELRVRYSGGMTDPPFVIHDHIVGAISGMHGVVVGIDPADGDPTSGHINILLHDGSNEAATVGEDLLVNGIKRAAADNTGIATHSQEISIVGHNNPFYGVFADAQGAMYVRFSDGSQQLDGFGLSRFTTPTQLASYTHLYSALGSEIYTETSGTGSITHLGAEASVALDIGTDAGDRVTRTTHNYHRYQAGYSITILMTIGQGDAGKEGVVRRWGYFDDNDGLFFEINEDELIVCLRRSVTGSVEELRVPQSEWNGDRLDGQGGPTNLSDVEINVTTINLFWIDFQWLGGGAARFGIFGKGGERIVCHTFENANTSPRPYMRSGSLPLRWEILNTTATASPSRMKAVCASVNNDGDLVADRKRRSLKVSADTGTFITASSTETPIFTIRSSLLFQGRTNRLVSLPELLGVYVKDNPIILRWWKAPTYNVDPTWVSAGAAEYALDPDVSDKGYLLFSSVFGCERSENKIIPDNFSLQGESLRLSADGTHGPAYLITAQSLEADPSEVFMALTWIDID
jgi:hypothetical protein